MFQQITKFVDSNAIIHRLSMMKVLIADDHALFRDGLSVMLETMSSDVVCLHASSLEGALSVLRKYPDIQLIALDINMPGIRSIQDISKVTHAYPEIPVVIISMHRDAKTIHQAFAQDIAGYIPKTHDSEAMQKAIDMVLSGKKYLPEEMLLNATLATSAPELTRGQKTVLDLIMLGKSNQEIADELFISLSTVKKHVGGLMEKMEVKSRAQLIVENHKLLDNRIYN